MYLVLSLITGQSQESYVDVKMGESEIAMEYDQELIFRHLFVHFDHPWFVLMLIFLLKDVFTLTLLRMRRSMGW